MPNKLHETWATDLDANARQALFGTDGSGNPIEAVFESDGRLKVSVSGTGASSSQVQGTAASGSAVVGNPVLVGGSDGTNARSLRTANDGTVRVDPTGTTTQPVSVVAGSAIIGRVGIDQTTPGTTNAVAITIKPVVGAHANAWNATAAGAGDTSTAVDCQYTPFVSAFGNSDAATTITLQYSQDNTNFYDGGTQVLAGAGNFRIDATTGARYHRLKTSGAATITATIAGKG